MSARRAAIAALAGGLLALPATAAAQGGGKPVVGGGSFNNAPLLAPGAYTDTVAAGETVYWKVHLQKGQLIRVKATVDTSQVETDPTAADWMPGLYHLDYRLDIFSPLRERLSGESGGGYDTATEGLEGDPEAGEKAGTATGPRALGYEQLLAGDYDKDVFPAPGEWYVSLSAADTDFAPAEIPLELPVDLDVQVLGVAQPSSPDFAKALPGPPKQQPRRADAGPGERGRPPRHGRPARRPRADHRPRRGHRARRRPPARGAGVRAAQARAPAPSHMSDRRADDEGRAPVAQGGGETRGRRSLVVDISRVRSGPIRRVRRRTWARRPARAPTGRPARGSAR